jgi:hypothetical protein
MGWVLIADDDFLQLKRRFAALDGRRLSRGNRESQAAAGDRGYNSLSTTGMAHEKANPDSHCLPACPGKIPEAVHCTPARARRC